MAAKLIGQRNHQLPGRLTVSEIFFEVPKDYDRPSEGTLRLFARSMERFEKPVTPTVEPKQQPWFLYLEGGPGFGCRIPSNYAWTDTILDKGYKVLLLDQRGTGMSSTISARTLGAVGAPQQQAKFLKNFRADSIVKDCEAVRKVLTAAYPEEKKKWSIAGQSFGGFCAINYLSRFPDGLREVFIMGGLAPLVKSPDPVYKYLFRKVAERNRAYYTKYPEDVHRIKALLKYIGETPIPLPGGGKLSLARFRHLGMQFGFHGGIDTVHDLVFRMVCDHNQFGYFTRATLTSFENLMSFDTAPLYAILHESLYCQKSASKWSAARVMKQYPEFMIITLDGSAPVFFTGEMIFPEMFEDFEELVPLRETADILANDEDWPMLYDEEQLARNEIPVYSAAYVNDMYVHYDFARETAAKIKNCKVFITNSLYHDASSQKATELFKHLFALRDDTLD